MSARAEETSAVMQCVNSTIVNGQIHLTHIREGTGDVISRDEWVIRCQGPAALRAWEQFLALRKSDPVSETNQNGAQALVLATGRGSRCIKLTRNPDGTPGNRAVCDISLDLMPRIQTSGALGK
jgi:hypothetical protein